MELDDLLRLYQAAALRMRQAERKTFSHVEHGLESEFGWLPGPAISPVEKKRETPEPLVTKEVAAYLEAWYRL